MDNPIKWFEENFFSLGCEMIKEGVLGANEKIGGEIKIVYL